jgi:hypothetical protein
MPASARPLLKRLSVFAAKAEGTPGTAETLAAGDGVFDVWDHEINEQTDFNTRPGQSVFSPLTGVPGPRGGVSTFKLWLTGAAGLTADAWATVLLPSCGMLNTSSTYTPKSDASSPANVTIGKYTDGRLKRIAGAQGKFKLTMESGKPGLAEFNFLGQFVAPSAVAKLAPNYPRAVPPRLISATLTIAATNYTISKIEVDYNNTLILRPDPTTASGYFGSCITDRVITIGVDPEALGYGTKDWNTDWTAGTEAAFNCVLGTTATNIVTIAAPKMQLMEPPNEGEREGILVDQLKFQCNRSVDAGDDEFSIVLS